jgi:hypothetical protein
MFVSCKSKVETSQDFMKWFTSQDNPLMQKQEMAEFQYSATLLPPAYFQAKNILMKDMSQQEDSSIYIKLEVKILGNSTDPLSYKTTYNGESEQRLNYLISEIQSDAFLITDKDTFTAALHHFERTYHSGNSIVVMFTYEQKFDPHIPFKFIYRDNLFGSGPIVFDFDKKSLESVPVILK